LNIRILLVLPDLMVRVYAPSFKTRSRDSGTAGVAAGNMLSLFRENSVPGGTTFSSRISSAGSFAFHGFMFQPVRS
jgi:hypothetical protein